MKAALQQVLAGRTLGPAEAEAVMSTILDGTAPPEQIAGLLTALRLRGETAEEILGFARVLKRVQVPFSAAPGAIDTCGTGGDGAGTFNVSTAAALVAAGAGVRVAKHGNRAASSRCGSADVLEALGVPITLDAAAAAKSLDEARFCFLFAPSYHPALARVRPIRIALGVPTVFNLLGPLVNPARVRRQVLGVADASLLPVFAEILRAEGAEEAMIVHGRDGIDEISLCDDTDVAHLKGGHVESYRIAPEELGFARAARETLAGGDARENADIIEKILRGRERGPKRDVVLLNAAAAIVVAGEATTLPDGVASAARAIDGGDALAALERLRRRG